MAFARSTERHTLASASDPRRSLGSATRDHLPVADTPRQSAPAREMMAALQPDGTDRAVFDALIIPPHRKIGYATNCQNTRPGLAVRLSWSVDREPFPLFWAGTGFFWARPFLVFGLPLDCPGGVSRAGSCARTAPCKTPVRPRLRRGCGAVPAVGSPARGGSRRTARGSCGRRSARSRRSVSTAGAPSPWRSAIGKRTYGGTWAAISRGRRRRFLSWPRSPG